MWEQKAEIHRSLRPNKSGIPGEEGKQQAVVVITKRWGERDLTEQDESELSYCHTDWHLHQLKDNTHRNVCFNIPATFTL